MGTDSVVSTIDPGQLKKRDQDIKFQKMQEQDDLREVLSTPAGKRLVWRLLGKCKIADSIYEASSRIYYLAGRQDLGHDIVKEIDAVDPLLFWEMRNEVMKGLNNGR